MNLDLFVYPNPESLIHSFSAGF